MSAKQKKPSPELYKYNLDSDSNACMMSIEATVSLGGATVAVTPILLWDGKEGVHVGVSLHLL